MTNDELGQAVEATQRALADLGSAISRALAPALIAAGEIAQQMYGILWQAYLEDGAIYGETDDGMLRWYKERAEIDRLRAEADRIEQHQALVRDFRLAQVHGAQKVTNFRN